MLSQQKDPELQQPPSDTVTQLAFSPVADYLAASSWDGLVRVWECQPTTGQSIPKCQLQCDGPAMCTAWSPDGMTLFAGGSSTGSPGSTAPVGGKHSGKVMDLQTGQSVSMGQHDAPIRSAFYFQPAQSQSSILATASWDKTVKYWDARSPSTNPIGGIQLPERAYVMHLSYPLMVVATAERHLCIVNLQGDPNKIYKTISSPLKFQTRSVCSFADKSGFAIGSIEGRVAIQYVEDSDAARNFSFKCHRDGSNVYAVNDISFHPTYGTFSTAGSDGTMNFWDKDSKQRLKSFANMNSPITSTTFSRTGALFAYACGYDWAKGHEYHRQDDKPRVHLSPVKEDDIAPRAKKR